MKTKLAVHCAPSVYIIVPGWIWAVSAGAQATTATLGGDVPAVAVPAEAKPADTRSAMAANANRGRDKCMVTPSRWRSLCRVGISNETPPDGLRGQPRT